MSRNWRAREGILIALAGILTIAGGCRSRPSPPGPAAAPPRQAPPPQRFTSNGEQIYYTATSRYDDTITFTDGPMWLRMHGGSCVNCHGPAGRGGIQVMMTNQVAPDIRYSTLTKPMKHDSEMEPAYTDAGIRRAITQGLDSSGKPLDPAMPRWHMPDRDLNDLIAYLKELDHLPQGGAPPPTSSP